MEDKMSKINDENFQKIENGAEEEQFSVLLNGQRDLEEKLADFKKSCEDHNKSERKRGKRRYYNLGLMAKVVTCTTEDELKHLLENGTRTFLVDTVANKPNEVKLLVSMIRQAVSELQTKEPCSKLVVGLALEIAGDCCRIGRIRNNSSIFLERGSTMTLTTNMAYRYSCFKEIAYIINLKYYLPTLKLNDQIIIGPEVRATIVKKLKGDLTILIEDAGNVNSYEYIQLPNQCYSLPLQTLPDMFNMDLALAAKTQADFIVIPRVRFMSFLKVLRYNLNDKFTAKLIGTIDLEYVSANMIDLLGIIKQLDVLWLTNLYNITPNMHSYICQDVIPLAKRLKKPIIGTVPLERCSDFKIFENHEFLWKIDCMFIMKSPWCKKYPLIVKKLLPIKTDRLSFVENTMALSNCSSYQTVVNFIIRTISSIECQAIFLYTKCETAASALGRTEIYCPVFVLLPLEETNSENADETKCRIQLAKSLNLRRNLKVILYSKQINECDYKPIEFGVQYARRCGCIKTGDFIITLEMGKENGDENVQLGVGEHVVIMRAFYVPPLKVGEQLICN